MPPVDSGIFGPEEFAAVSGVSRETLSRLKRYAVLLEDWNGRHNLVSAGSLVDLWRRHFWDSAQLASLLPPGAATLVDLGSGAGFPGLVLAELRRGTDFSVTLYEATAKKCRFLQAVADELGLLVEIQHQRIEEVRPQRFDIVTARACAPLVKLLPYAQRFWGKGTVGYFLKGQNLEVELTQAHKSWSMKPERHPSQSDVSGVVLEIRELHRRK